MAGPRVVLDTNVLVAAARSRRGVASRVLSLVGTGLFEIAVSVPLVLEYEDVLGRHLHESRLNDKDVGDLLDYLCHVAHRQEVFYLWRPMLKDPNDDMVLELAVAAQCDAIVTYNQRDFAGAHRFNVEILEPREFLQRVGE
jgi:putative PIN family toxin of toxin-antitoxin system